MPKRALLLVAAVIMLAGCGAASSTSASPSPSPSSQQLGGWVLLHADELGDSEQIESAAETDVWYGDPVDDDTCTGEGGYADLREGAQVTVEDESGKTLGLGRLSDGKYIILDSDGDKAELEELADGFDENLYAQQHEPMLSKEEQSANNQDYPVYSGMCEFRFTVDLAKPADFYVIEVAERGELTYSHEELQEAGWFVPLEIGR